MTLAPMISLNLFTCSVCADELDLHSESHCRFGECGEQHEGHIDEAESVFPWD